MPLKGNSLILFKWMAVIGCTRDISYGADKSRYNLIHLLHTYVTRTSSFNNMYFQYNAVS